MPRSPKVPNPTTINANTGQAKRTLPSRPNAKTPLCDHDIVRFTRNTRFNHSYHSSKCRGRSRIPHAILPVSRRRRRLPARSVIPARVLLREQRALRAVRAAGTARPVPAGRRGVGTAVALYVAAALKAAVDAAKDGEEY